MKTKKEMLKDLKILRAFNKELSKLDSKLGKLINKTKGGARE